MLLLKFFFRKCKEFIWQMKLLYSDWIFLRMFYNDKKNDKDEVLFSLLRKDCHILDKGLHTIPFEKGHGKQVYREAFSLKNKLVNTSFVDDPSFSWCEQVISTYECAQSNEVTNLNKSYHIYNDEDRKMIYEYLFSRVSCRNFNNDVISDSIWNSVIEIAADAPNGCCRQTSRAYIINNQNIISKLRDKIAGATSFSNGIPYLLCITADTRPYMCIDRILAYVDASLFVENLVLACRANNIFTTILNFQHASEKERKFVSECLSIPSYERIILFIAAGRVDFVPEKPVRMSVKYFRKL